MRAVEILEEGRKKIESDWWQGTQPSTIESVCASTALFCSVPVYDKNCQEARTLLGRAIGFDFGDDPMHVLLDSIYEWNDDPSRTKEEVLAAYDRAIAGVREQELVAA